MQHISKRTLTFTEQDLHFYQGIFFLKTHANEDSTITDLTKHIKLKGI